MPLADWMSSPSAFYLLLLLEYQTNPTAPHALSDTFVYADSVLYNYRTVITKFSQTCSFNKQNRTFCNYKIPLVWVVKTFTKGIFLSEKLF